MRGIDARTVDPERLIAAMKAAGFVLAGYGRGHVRFGRSGQEPRRGALLVPTDPAAPEFGQLMGAVLAELEYAAGVGAKARRVLDALGGACDEEGEGG